MSDADPSLSVPELPTLSRELGSPAFPLHRTPPLDDDPPFTLAGARLSIAGGCARGVNRVRADHAPILARLRVEGAIAASATLTPVGLERELRIEDVGVLERVVVARADPVCFFEWRAERDRPLVLRWVLPGLPWSDGEVGDGARWRAVERGLVAETPAGRTLFAFSRAPAELAVDAGGVAAESVSPGALEVRARWEPMEASGCPGGPPRSGAGGETSGGGAVRMAVGFVAAGGDEARVLRVMGRSHVVVPAVRAAALRVLQDRLSLEAPDTALAEALGWAAIRLAAGGKAGEPARPGPAGGGRQGEGVGRIAPLDDRELRVVLAALATGDRASARARLASAGDPMNEEPGEATRQLVLVARYLAWTGDLRTVGMAWETTRARALARVSALHDVASSSLSGREPRAPSLLLSALRELVPAAEEVGDGDLARRVRGALAASPHEEPGRPAGEGMHRGAEDPEADELLAAAALVEAVVEGLLGVEPDAPRGRLVLRPRLPRSWDSCAVRNLRVGDAVVELDLDREDARYAFTLRQVGGGAPLRVVFEPELAGARLVGARVDGEVAQLEALAAEGRIRVPVQVVLDHARRVEVEIEGAGA